jgi:alpha-1,3-rhamnosyl/mannosyltransferase
VTRHPELVPDGVRAVPLSTASQELRMSWTFPRLLGRLGASLVHTQYAIPLRCPCPAVVTVHDVSFERDPGSMPRSERAVFRRVVPRAVRRARRVLTVSERSRDDIVGLYRVPPEHVVVTPNGVDPAFHPGEAGERGYALVVGAIQARKNQLAALAAAHEAGLPLVVVGPTRDAALADELRRRGARLEGYVPVERLAELYRGAACLVQPSTYEGFGLPVLEAMASGTPVVTVADDALLEVVGEAAVVRDEAALADGIREAVADRDRLAWAGLERARAFSWRATAEATVAVYLQALASAP